MTGKRKASTTQTEQPETQAGGEGAVPPQGPEAPPGAGGEPPRQDPPSGSSERPQGEPPKQPEREPFDLGDVVAVGATLALGLLLLVVMRGRRSFF